MPELSVIIPTAARPDSLLACVRSILAGNTTDLEVLVIDQDPSQRLRETLRQTFGPDPRIRYLYQQQRALDVARNNGAREARSNVIAFLDDDTEVGPDYAASILARFRETPNTGIVGGPLVLADELTLPTWWPAERRGLLALVDQGERRELTGGALVAGANLATTKEAFEHVGGFDESLDYAMDRVDPLLSGGDSLFCLRIKALGLKIIHEPAAMVVHRIATEKLNPGYLLRRSFWEGVTQVVVTKRSGRQSPWWRIAASYGLLAAKRLVSAIVHPLTAAAWYEFLAACSTALGVIYCPLVYRGPHATRRQ